LPFPRATFSLPLTTSTMSSDTDRIDLASQLDIDFWCGVFHVAPGELRHAVQQVGPQAAAVRRYLAEHPPAAGGEGRSAGAGGVPGAGG
jgi:hypothetical protein